MYTFHLWVELKESEEQKKTNESSRLNEKFQHILTWYEERLGMKGPAEPINQMNGLHVFQCTCVRNHYYGEHEEMLGIMDWIAENISQSHGVVYWNDDEHSDPEMANSFRVIRLDRGKITESPDTLLSPIRPTIEDL